MGDDYGCKYMLPNPGSTPSSQHIQHIMYGYTKCWVITTVYYDSLQNKHWKNQSFWTALYIVIDCTAVKASENIVIIVWGIVNCLWHGVQI